MMNDQIENHTHEKLEEVLLEYPNLECDRLTDRDFERIGDAVMEQIHPETHEMMDAMMTSLQTPERSNGVQEGEGTERLSLMHINMGKEYLNCFAESRDGVMNMMGYGTGTFSGMPMMYNNGFGALWGINSLLVTILLVVLIRYFWVKGGKK